MNTPNSPSELFSLNNRPDPELDHEDADGFARYILNTAMEEMQPSPDQVALAAKAMLEHLASYHFSVLQGDDQELNPWQKRLWSEDLERLTTAITNLRALNYD